MKIYTQLIEVKNTNTAIGKERIFVLLFKPGFPQSMCSPMLAPVSNGNDITANSEEHNKTMPNSFHHHIAMYQFQDMTTPTGTNTAHTQPLAIEQNNNNTQDPLHLCDSKQRHKSIKYILSTIRWYSVDSCWKQRSLVAFCAWSTPAFIYTIHTIGTPYLWYSKQKYALQCLYRSKCFLKIIIANFCLLPDVKSIIEKIRSL